MKRLTNSLLAVVALVAFLDLAQPAHAEMYSVCKTFKGSATRLTSGIFEFSQNKTGFTVWYKSVDNGLSGPPLVQVTIYGPEADSAANRASGPLYATGQELGNLTPQKYSTTFVGPVEAISFTITNCTGTCDVRLYVCGINGQ